MNTIHMLNRAARSAALLASMRYQDQLLAGVAVRGDGAIVSATNKASRVADGSRQWSTHVEVRLCRKLDADAVVYVARVLRRGGWGTARPCPNCLKRMKRQRVKRVYYTISEGEYGTIDL